MTGLEEIFTILAALGILVPIFCSIMYIIGKNKFEKEVLKNFMTCRNSELIYLKKEDAYEHFVSIQNAEQNKKLEIERLKRYIDEQASRQTEKLADEIKKQLTDIGGRIGKLEELFLNHVIGGK